MDYLSLAKKSIENFSIDESDYALAKDPSLFSASNDQNQVFMRSENCEAKILINFGKTRGCKVFLGKNIRGNVTINIRGNNSIIYIGDNCFLRNLELRSKQRNDFIAIGEGVTTTSTNVWISGNGAGGSNPGIVIGDDCMFSYDIVIRNSDAHPIFDLDSDTQINLPKTIVHIEPHVWVGEQVNILKSVTIGACSVIALGSVVSKDVDRFSIAKGNPAISTKNESVYWARNYSESTKTKAKYYITKYRSIGELKNG